MVKDKFEIKQLYTECLLYFLTDLYVIFQISEQSSSIKTAWTKNFIII